MLREEGGREEAPLRAGWKLASRRACGPWRICLNMVSVFGSTAEERLRARVSLLRDQYREAVAAAERASAAFADKSVPTPDGSLAYRNALVAERGALRAYTEAVADLAYLTRQSPKE